ncbi:MAG: S49 family peptidase [Deltaproteobacteria bacterium]|nr:MAG: S49 family peptidase [Deltaproteobacteria bacterium]
MVSRLARAGASLAASPLLGATHLVRKALTSRGKVVELKVARVADVRQRMWLTQRVRRLGRDPGVKGVLLTIESAPGGWASTEDLRRALVALREDGVKVVACLEAPGNAALWLASACEVVGLVPSGQLMPLGLGGEMTFFGAALERLGVRPDFESAGAYKSFGEPFTRTFASEANREATEELIGGLHDQLLSDLSQARGISLDALQALAAVGPLSAEEALEHGLVDVLAYPDELLARFTESGHDLPETLEFDKWARVDAAAARLERMGRGGGSVAIVHLEGAIVLDKGLRKPQIQARKAVETLRKLRENDEVKAVVLNLSSPGGSALASDLIWRELVRLGQEKLLVASYEDVSASGGVYLSAPAARIFARQGTITGSIGVFGGKLVLGEGLRRLGVHRQFVGPAEGAAFFTPSRRFTDAERARFRASLQKFYDGFVERVAEGRGAEVSDIEPYCRGRVWTGTQAYEHGLIDEIGDVRDAVRFAREEAGLPRSCGLVEASLLPKRNPVQWAMDQAGSSSELVALARAAGLVELQPAIDLLTQPSQALALLPFEVRPR